jgi:hypothetical protein
MESPVCAGIKRKPGPPWRIGWFGAIRCRKSLAMLARLAREGNGKIEVIIRGRPSLDQFDDFYLRVSSTPGLSFLGTYKNPEELASIYCDVHFTWAIDMFEEGMNSTWLLPNRLYEGGMHGAVPIALASVETGAFIRRLDIGVTVNNEEDLTSFFHGLTSERYYELRAAVLKIPDATWRYDTQDCKDLIAYLDGLRH